MDFFKNLYCKILGHKWQTVIKSIWAPRAPLAEQKCKRCNSYRNVLRVCIDA